MWPLVGILDVAESRVCDAGVNCVILKLRVLHSGCGWHCPKGRSWMKYQDLVVAAAAIVAADGGSLLY